jgi:hypothetical protein
MFFIFDCNGAIVGNPKGYRTHKGAERQCKLNGNSKVMQTLWNRFFERSQIDGTKTRIYSIRWVDQPKSEAAQALDNAFNDPVKFMREHFQIIHIS